MKETIPDITPFNTSEGLETITKERGLKIERFTI